MVRVVVVVVVMVVMVVMVVVMVMLAPSDLIIVRSGLRRVVYLELLSRCVLHHSKLLLAPVPGPMLHCTALHYTALHCTAPRT
jgi:hypothetical protein